MQKKRYNKEDFYFDLPEELIAEFPATQRDESKLFVLDRKNSIYTHSTFKNLISFLRKDDLLIFNNARVLHARIFFKRESGARVEVVLTKQNSEKKWKAVTNRTKRIRIGEKLFSEKNSSYSIEILEKIDGAILIETSSAFTANILEDIGEIPLPPYIRRKPIESDNTRYQTIYASETGAVAAPTAGLHFTDEIFSRLDELGIEKTFLTLYVSWGTFQPVRTNSLSEHKMHSEKFFLPEETANKINLARKQNRRVVAVGTTSLRVLESTYNEKKKMNLSGFGETDIFIYPPKKIKSIDAIITNFHTPYSTLLMLVASFAGYDLIMDAYREAVKERYRFFSYGDSMFIQ